MGIAGAIVWTGCGTAPALPARTSPTAAPTAQSAVTAVPPGRLLAAVLVITIGGTSPASRLTIHVDNRRIRLLGPVALPYVFTDTRLDDIDGAYPVTVEAEDASTSHDALMTCRIEESGSEVAHDAARGPRSVAWCSDNQPQDPLRPPGTTVRSRVTQRQ